MSIYGGHEKVDYGQWIIALSGTTSDTTTHFMGGGMQERWANNLWKLYSAHYVNCFVDLIEIDGSHNQVNAWYRKLFTSEAAIMAFCAANAVTGGGQFTNSIQARFYDIIDYDMPRITKMYGINQFYSVLRGSKRYYPSYDYRYIYPQAASHSWSNMQSFVQDVINVTTPPASPYTYNALHNSEAAIWFSQSKSGLYGLPNPGTVVQLAGNARNRKVFSTGSSDFEPAPGGGAFNYILDKSRYYTMYIPNGNWTQIDRNAANFNVQFRDANMSMIAVYSIIYVSGAWHYAAFIKPIGVDNIIVNYYNNTKYDLYGHYEHKWRHPDIKIINPLINDGDMNSNSIWVPKNRWFWWKAQSFPSAKMTSEEFPITRFFLRDKVTNLISPYSTSKLVVSKNHRDAMFKIEVKHNA